VHQYVATLRIDQSGANPVRWFAAGVRLYMWTHTMLIHTTATLACFLASNPIGTAPGPVMLKATSFAIYWPMVSDRDTSSLDKRKA